MNHQGLTLCSRFAYPPNSYALCGPSKQNDLQWYASQKQTDKGLSEILSQFATLYPYLCFIAGENNMKDPFDPLVVEAYWIGNSLLEHTSRSRFSLYLTDTLGIKQKITRHELDTLLSKLPQGALPHHAFHVLNIWRRTGHHDITHTLPTMEACLINWGKITKILKKSVIIATQPLQMKNDQLVFGDTRTRNIHIYDTVKNLKSGDWISYHWGTFCIKLSRRTLYQLIFYTQKALNVYNHSFLYEEKNYIRAR